MSKGTTRKSVWKDLPGLQQTLGDVESAVKWIELYGDDKPVGIMIHGPTGAGKSYIKDKLIAELGFKEGEVLHLNAATFHLNRDLAWSEFFGHKEGSFTGADNDKEGVLAKNYKAVVLDEFEMLPKDIQAILLVYLDKGSFKRLGATKEEYSRTHLILLTNQSPEEHQEQGLYRDDFLNRLHRIEVPGLSERKEDILVLAHHFLEEYRKKTGEAHSLKIIEAVAMLFYDWPGGAREVRLRIFEHQSSWPYPMLFRRLPKGFYKKIRDFLTITQKVDFLSKYSSLFPPSGNIYDECDLSRADTDFWMDFWTLGGKISCPKWEELQDAILRHIREGIDYATAFRITPPLAIKEQVLQVKGLYGSPDVIAMFPRVGQLYFPAINEVPNFDEFLEGVPPDKHPSIRKQLEPIMRCCRDVSRALQMVFPNKESQRLPNCSLLGEIDPALPGGIESTLNQTKAPTVTISLEQPWKKAQGELERQYWTYHLNTKIGQDLVKAVGIEQGSISRWRKKFGFCVSKS